MEVKGRVKAVKQLGDKYGVMLTDENWYNAFGKCPAQKNDHVLIEYVTKGKFHNITDIKIIGINDGDKGMAMLKTFCFTKEEQLDNAVNMFAKEHDVLAWQPNAVQCGEGLILYVCFVTYRVRA